MTQLSLRASIITILISLFFPPCISAEEVSAPEQLRPWIEWVKDRSPNLSCPTMQSSKVCSWPGHLALDVTNTGANFSYHVALDAESTVTLPGNNNSWPLQLSLKDSDQPVVVSRQTNRPITTLKKGSYIINGSFRWQSVPREITIPTEVGTVSLRLRGKEIRNPKISQQGSLWLSDATETPSEATTADSLQIQVKRLLIDDLPFRVKTVLELRASGAIREVSLGNPSLTGATQLNINSSLVYKISPKQELTVQLKPGFHTIEIEELFQSPPESLTPPQNSSSFWPQQEFWAWQSNEQLRSVELHGASAIDAERANLPSNWQSYPTYVLSSTDSITFKLLRRGETLLSPNQLTLNRTLWLSLDGSQFTAQDQINGTASRNWRLNATPALSLGNVKLNNKPQLITKDSALNLEGVEIRNQFVNATAVSTINSTDQLPAVGWDFDVTSLSTTLNLPPGWQLFWADGVDSVSNSWLTSWSLLDVFVVILVAVAAAKLLGWPWGIVGILSFIASHNTPGAPYILWFHLIATVALLTALPVGAFRTATVWYFRALSLLLFLVILPFAFYQLRSAIFPQIPEVIPDELNAIAISIGILQGGVAVLLAAGLILTSLVKLLNKKWAEAGIFFIAALISYSILSFTPSPTSYQSQQRYSQRDLVQEKSRQAVTAPAAGSYEMAPLMEVASAPAPDSYQKVNERKEQLEQIDPNAIVQTGPGIPNWSWKSWSLNFNGPIAKDHQIEIVLLGPIGSFFLTLLRITFISLFALALIRQGLKKSAPLLLMLALSLGAVPQQASAEDLFPSESLLNELQLRIEQKICKENCTVNEQLSLELNSTTLTAKATVVSDGPGAWAAPGPSQNFLVTEVKINGEVSHATRRDSAGFLWIRVPAGRHNVEVTGAIAESSNITLQFLMPPGHTSFSSGDWLAEGISETGAISSTVQLTRKSQPQSGVVSASTEEVEVDLANWYQVQRQIELGTTWQVRTTVYRLGSSNKPTTVEVALLDGEKTLDSQLEQKEKKVAVSFARGQQQRSWTSSLEQNPTLTLEATSDNSINESWQLNCSTIWSCQTKGLAPTTQIENARQTFQFNPWPKERLEVAVSKPAAVAGESATVEEVRLNYTLGSRIIETELNLTINASSGGWQTVTLPAGAQLDVVQRDSSQIHVREEENKLSLPIEPGRQNYRIAFRLPYEMQLLQKMPSIDLGTTAYNINTTVQLPEKRWLLATFGPSWGPAVLFWSKLFGLVIFALIIVRIKVKTISFASWVLLGFGLLSLSPAVMLVPLLWMLALEHRQNVDLIEKPSLFNLRQALIGALTLVFLMICYWAIKAGLIHMPEMGVSGNNSTSTTLNWYLDQTKSSSLAEIQIFSVDLWVWRAIMILWSTWLVFSLIKWLRNGWDLFKNEQLWVKIADKEEATPK